ncbi:transglycosylase SLT domain-containing protein [Lusitaniella coriacea]|uniref:transglycosylase SLT domain-containing protein n=1 Tax=Lusitaniella coriacea TaxID=1983105 RepID=UPI003CE8B1B6
MAKGRTIQTILTVSLATMISVLLGATLYVAMEKGWVAQLQRQFFASGETPSKPEDDSESLVLPLTLQAPEERRSRLEEIATQDKASYDRNRARYLLASDWIEELEGGKALRLLEGLENEYPVLAPHILLKRARAYELTNELTKSRQTLEQLLEQHPEANAAAQALYLLGKSNPEYHDTALTRFPNHPFTHQVARDRLDKDPNQANLLLFLVRQTPTADGMSAIRDRVVKKYALQLTPEDWGAIADAYWEQGEYGPAAEAYSKTDRAPKSLYRVGRGRQLSGNNSQAKAAYQTLVQAFPEAEETGLALSRLAQLSPPQEALGYLDRIIENFRDRAPDALIRKANLHEKLRQGKLAGQARQTLLDQYSNSDEASKYRWESAKKLAEKGKYADAWKWAHPIAQDNPDSSLAPKAAFWVGKWATQLNLSRDAKAAYEYVLTNYPESYYAWRSAVRLGWDVGDFATLRQMNPPIETPQQRPVPPAGSEVFKELYQLGQDRDAEIQWDAELGNKAEPSVPEHFTEALLLLAQEEYLKGINQIWALKNAEGDGATEEWQALRQTPEYWHALFPFPYKDSILEWSQERQLNPLLVVSLMRQESRFEEEIRSPVGATGLMQVMPATGKEVAQKSGISDYKLTNPEDNIAIGTWYLDFTHRENNDNSLLAIAGYNAGPGNVATWLKRYGFNDSDRFVEQIPFGETKGYVESVFGNYWNYLRLYDPEVAQKLETRE